MLQLVNCKYFKPMMYQGKTIKKHNISYTKGHEQCHFTLCFSVLSQDGISFIPGKLCMKL